MFTNINGCTVYEKAKHNREPIFIRHQTADVYWEETLSQRDGKDRTPANRALIIIPNDSADYCPKPGDKVIGMIIADERPPADAMTIMSVKDFRYGSPKVQHIEVIAE